MAGAPLRVMVFDATCRGKGALPGLSHIWQAGSGLYKGLGRIDRVFGASSWQDALSWLCRVDAGRPIAEVQFWGHGKWGSVMIDGEPLGEASLDGGHEHRPLLDELRRRLESDSLWWFRTCETFGAERGQRFALEWTRFFDCRAAGHTFIIATWQSGLHSLAAGQSPRWHPDEGLREGSPADPRRALWSRPWHPNTVSCLTGRIPAGY